MSGFCFSFHHKHSKAVFKKKGKNPHSEAVKKGQIKIHLRHRRKKKRGKKIQEASPHQ